MLRQRFASDPSVTFQVPSSVSSSGLTPRSMLITIPNDDLPADELLTVDFNPVLPNGSPSLGGDPFIFSLTLSDPNTGAMITQFADPVTIGFSDQPLPGNLTFGDLALGYLNEKSTKWEVQDSALKKNGDYLCGKTDHFTVFALAETAAVPEPTTGGLMLVGVVGLMRRRVRRVS